MTHRSNKSQSAHRVVALFLCGIGALVFWPVQAQAANGQCKWEGGPGSSQYPSCIEEDCVEDGGLALCKQPELRPPTGSNDTQVDGQKFGYGMCDMAAASIPNIATWCAAQGGTWVVVGPGTQRCEGLPAQYPGVGSAASESAADSASDNWINLKFSNCTATPEDSGWNFDNTGDQLCGGTQLYQGQTLIADIKQRRYTINCPTSQSTFRIKITKRRKYECPDRYSQRTKPGGELQCFQPQGCYDTGNPVCTVTGAKKHRETDYQATDGLQFGRFYHSAARFRLPSAGGYTATAADYWRFTFSRRVIAAPANPNLMAYLQGDDGIVRQFDGTGKEIHNLSGAADRLEALGGTGWRLTRANRDVELYNVQGQLTQITTRAGAVTTVSYDANGRLASVANTFGRSLQFGYDTSNRLTTVTIPGGGQITYHYDSYDRLTSVVHADATTRGYHYEHSENSFLLTGITDENNVRFATYNYNDDGRVTSEYHAGNVNRYTFSIGDTKDSTPSATITDPLGNSRIYRFTRKNGVFRPTDTSEYCPTCANIGAAGFDANGNYSFKTDLNSVRTNYVHDQMRNLETQRTEGLTSTGGTTPITRTITTQWHPVHRLPVEEAVYAGAAATGNSLRRTTMSYDSAGNLLTRTLTDPATSQSRTWTYTYDALGRVLTEDGPRTDVLDVTTRAYYLCTSGNQCGQLATVTNALGHVTTYDAYDANGQPTRITDANNIVTTLSYDSRQRLTARCSNGLLPACVGGELSTMEYWPTGLLKKVTNPDGSYLRYTYDDAQRLVQVEDALGNRESYVLDGAGNRQVTNSYDPFGALAQTRTTLYNDAGQLWQILTAAGTDTTTTVFSYDAQGNQTTTSAPLGRVTTNSYDQHNRLAQTTDPAGGLTRFGYDANDNLTTVTDPRNLVTSYQYNGLGDLLQLTSPDTGVTANSYDSAGNLLTSTNARNAITQSTYDALGRVLTTAFKIGATTDQSISYGYDVGANAKGRMVSAADANHSLAWVYDAHGRVTTKTQAVGTVSKSIAYGFANGRMTSMTTPSGQVIGFTYDLRGQVIAMSVNGAPLLTNVLYEPLGPIAGWTWGNNTLAVRQYDLDGRVRVVDSAGFSSYEYDDAGQIASRYDDSLNAYMLTPGTSNVTTSATSNRLASTTGVLSRSYSFDPAGNTTAYGPVTLTYNNANRMKSATAAGVTTNYLYNALGQRIRKSAGANAIHFVYDEAGQLVGEYDASGTLIQEMVWFGNIPVATLRPKSGGGVDVYYVHTDHLNTPRRISKPADNTIVWRWDSDPFGEAPANPDPDGDSLQFAYQLRFPGQYMDSETGLHYNYFRDYDAAIGRYVESDPIGLDGGINTYTYVAGNPILRTDPEGLDYWLEDADPSESGLGFHQSICVGEYGSSNRYCISFGRKPGQGNCWFDCEGHVYQDRSPPGDIIHPMHRATPSSVDRKIRRYLRSRLGEQRPWDVLGGENCRVFSQRVFEQLVKQYGGDTPKPAPAPPIQPPVHYW